MGVQVHQHPKISVLEKIKYRTQLQHMDTQPSHAPNVRVHLREFPNRYQRFVSAAGDNSRAWWLALDVPYRDGGPPPVKETSGWRRAPPRPSATASDLSGQGVWVCPTFAYPADGSDDDSSCSANLPGQIENQSINHNEPHLKLVIRQ